MKQTGKQRYRVGWFGRVILQVEWTYYRDYSTGRSIESERVTEWRDARPQDVMDAPLGIHANGITL